MAKKRLSLVRKCLAFAELFEADLLLELMLRFWDHPFADDSTYRASLHASAMDVLRESAQGKKLMEEVPPAEMNFVAAMWYVEWNSVADNADDPTGKRRAWLERIRRSLPSCFCGQDLLP